MILYFISCSNIFCSQNKDQVSVENAGCKAMVSLFNGRESDSLSALWYIYLCKKVAAARSFVSAERLPHTASATKYHSLRTYYQVIVWMGFSENMNATKWDWKIQEDRYTRIMMDTNPAPDNLLKMVHCNCFTGCNTLRCSCKIYGLECTASCGTCQDSHCENIRIAINLDENED